MCRGKPVYPFLVQSNSKWGSPHPNNNNNNKAIKSQTSWGRLELKPNRNNRFRHVNSCLPSTPIQG